MSPAGVRRPRSGRAINEYSFQIRRCEMAAVARGSRTVRVTDAISAGQGKVTALAESTGGYQAWTLKRVNVSFL